MIISVITAVRPFADSTAEAHQVLASTVQGGALFITSFLGRGAVINVRSRWRRGS